MKLNELYENAPDVEITGIKINSKEINKQPRYSSGEAVSGYIKA